uniref:Putative secreted protein n=1 Tax=Anopheles triannulatus TaxID=58253 RepID=A0A2M4B4T8_9DIPT
MKLSTFRAFGLSLLFGSEAANCNREAFFRKFGSIRLTAGSRGTSDFAPSSASVALRSNPPPPPPPPASAFTFIKSFSACCWCCCGCCWC